MSNDPRNNPPPRGAKVTLRVANGDKKKDIASKAFAIILKDTEELADQAVNSLRLEIHFQNQDPVTFHIIDESNRQGVYLPPYNSSLQIYLSLATTTYSAPDETQGAYIYLNDELMYSETIPCHIVGFDLFKSSSIRLTNNSATAGEYGFKVCVPLLNNCSTPVRPNGDGQSNYIPTDGYDEGTLLFVTAFTGDNSDPNAYVIALQPFIIGEGDTINYVFNGAERFNTPTQ